MPQMNDPGLRLRPGAWRLLLGVLLIGGALIARALAREDALILRFVIPALAAGVLLVLAWWIWREA